MSEVTKRARANVRVAAISRLTRGTAKSSEGDLFGCQGCGFAFVPEVLEIAHRVPVRQDRSGGFQAGVFAKVILALPLDKARATARVLCANCHKMETASQRRNGWK